MMTRAQAAARSAHLAQTLLGRVQKQGALAPWGELPETRRTALEAAACAVLDGGEAAPAGYDAGLFVASVRAMGAALAPETELHEDASMAITAEPEAPVEPVVEAPAEPVVEPASDVVAETVTEPAPAESIEGVSDGGSVTDELRGDEDSRPDAEDPFSR